MALVQGPATGGAGSAIAVRTPWGPAAGLLAAGTMGASTVALDATADSVAMICRIEKDGTIDRVGFTMSAKTSSSATVRYFVGLVTVDSSGNPTDTAYGGSTPANPTQASLSAGLSYVSLSAAATATAGDLVAVRIWHDAASDAPTTAFWTLRTRFAGPVHQLPAVAENTAGSWARQTGIPILFYRYSDGTIGGGYIQTDSTYGPAALTASSTPDEFGALFTVPFACKIRGARIVCRVSPLTGTATVTLYDAADAVLASAALTAGELSLTSSWGIVDVFWDEQTLAADTEYRLTLTATDTASWTLGDWRTDSTDGKASIPEGARWQETERADAGAWTNTALNVPIMALHLSEMTV
jgi:hypothetical protein